MEIQRIASGDTALVMDAARLFDKNPRLGWVEDFLRRAGHHLLLAHVADRPTGFVSGIEILHPDKGSEMFLYELGVDEAYRGRGIGTALVAALRDLARDQGCRGMWVLTAADNTAAVRTYVAADADAPEPAVILAWEFPPDRS